MSVAPIPPETLPSVPGLGTPQRFYQVLRVPAPLAGMSSPDRPSWKAIAAAGFQSIVCLTNNTPPYDPSPLRVLRAVKFKDLVGGTRPDNPQREADMLRDVVHVVADELRAGRGVVVHCAGGTGRTGSRNGGGRSPEIHGHRERGTSEVSRLARVGLAAKPSRRLRAEQCVDRSPRARPITSGFSRPRLASLAAAAEPCVIQTAMNEGAGRQATVD